MTVHTLDAEEGLELSCAFCEGKAGSSSSRSITSTIFFSPPAAAAQQAHLMCKWQMDFNEK